MSPRAWEACNRYVPSSRGPARAGLRFPELVPRLGWGVPSPGPAQGPAPRAPQKRPFVGRTKQL